MHVIYHLGAHCTDNDRIVKCLSKNAQALEDAGIFVPAPQTYRTAISETMLELRHQDITADIQDAMVKTVLGDRTVERLILSHDAFLGVPGHAVGDHVFYPMLSDKVDRLAGLFGPHEIEFCLGVSNPAIFIPDVFSMAQESDLETFLAGSDPMRLRWSDVVLRLKAAVPTSKLTVWANEDTPLIWPNVLQAVSSHKDTIKLKGLEDFYATLLSPGGLKRMTGYLGTHPPKDAAHHQRIVGAFLEKFGREDVLETEIDLPGWTETYVTALSDLYEQDLAVIGRMEDVHVLRP